MIAKAPTIAYQERLATLLRGDLAFSNGDKNHLLHSLHAFAARFPPDLPRYFIEGLSDPGETVLDPMAGSGVTLTEAWLLGRNAIGVDLDPLARRLCEAKTTWFDPALINRAGRDALSAVYLRSNLSNPIEQVLGGASKATRDFIDYWFTPKTQKELAALILSVAEVSDEKLRRLFEVLVSSTIVTKSGGVSLARDLAHSRPHRVENKVPRNALEMFDLRLKLAARAFGEVSKTDKGMSTVVSGDTRSLPLAKDSVDLIVTSPPYANQRVWLRQTATSSARSVRRRRCPCT